MTDQINSIKSILGFFKDKPTFGYYILINNIFHKFEKIIFASLEIVLNY